MKSITYFLLLLSFVAFAQKQTQSLGFIENKGQILNQKNKKNNAVKYLLNTNGLNVQLRQNGFSYDIYETKKHPLTKKEKLQQSSFRKEDTLNHPNYTLEYIYHRIDIDFKNSLTNVELIAEEKSSDYDNYYNIPNEPNGILDVHKFQRVTYKNIYNNIDVVFFIPEDKTKPVEYNFIVKPNGKLSDIQLEFKGAKTELIDNKIRMNVRFGQMEETVPLSWIENRTKEEKMDIAYKKLKSNIYGFESSENLEGKKIIIDPTPVRLWGTYHGGPSTDYLKKMYSDNNENLFITGTTTSQNNFATFGSFITISLVANTDGYVAKLDSNSNRQWCTYLNSNPSDIKTDTSGNVITTGMTFSNLIGTPGTFQPTTNSLDGFILKLNTNGTRIWGTYFPGTITACAVGVNDNIYITGYDIVSGIATSGVHQEIKNGLDAFVFKFNPNGQRIWGTYYGGINIEEANDIAIDEFNNTYITGKTNSNGNIAYGYSYQMNFNNSNIYSHDGFLAKFNDQGNIVFGTYYGGDQNEFFTSIDYKNGRVVISGHTSTQSGISTSNAPHPNPINPYGNTSNGFFSIFSSSGQLLMGSYFQSTILDNQFDNNGNFFICGDSSELGIGTPNSYQPTPNWVDAFLVKYDINFNKVWGTYYGGDTFELETNLHVNNNIYLGGRTKSQNNISSSNAFQQIINGAWEDAYVVKFKDCQSSSVTSSNTPICVGNTLNLTASGGTNYAWTGPNGFTSNLQNPTITNANLSHSGQYSCSITGTGGCDATNTIDVFVGDATKPIPNVNPLPTITGDCNTTVSTPTATDNCAGTVTATTTDPLSYSLPGTYTIHWNYNDGNGNIETQEQTVTVNSVTLPTLTSPQIFCIQQNATLNSIAIIGQNIKWYDAQTGGNLLLSSTNLVDGTTYYASQTINSCESLRVPVLINIQNTPTTTGNASQSFCSTQNATLNNISVSGSNIIWYNSATSTTPLPLSTVLANGVTYYATQTINNCESVNRLSVTINLINTLNATNYSETLCDDLNDGVETVSLSNYNANLISNTTGCTFDYYSTLNGATNQISGDQINSNYNLNLGLNTIYVRITSINTCFQLVQLNLTLVSKPIIPIADIVPLCDNSNVTLNAGTNTNTYLWSTGATTPYITISQTGNYSVTATHNYGSINCSSTKNFVVVLSNAATISQIETVDWTDNQNTITVYLNSSSIGDYEYSIDGVNYQDSNVFSNLYGGIYFVYVRDKNGCGVIFDEVFLLNYPKFFTPNGDGYNDTWSVNFSYFEKGISTQIYDRYGKLIKVLNYKETWDGKYNGNMLPSDDYWFVVNRANGKVYKGHFAMKR